MKNVILGATAALASIFALPTEVLACGGFFCNRNQPVIQNAERIIFIDHGDGQVTTMVQIQYSGPAEQFSWIVPVPGIPEVGVSSSQVFTQLDRRTAPRFNLSFDDACPPPRPPSAGSGGLADAGSANVDLGASPGVSVIASGSVGPFDYEVIRPDPGLEDAAAVAVKWLEDNDYDVGAIGADKLRPYLDMGQNLIGFRLQKSATTGDIRPVTLKYAAERSLIPIQLTAVAAQPDMGVLVWVFGPDRAVPMNYLSLEPNLALVNWFSLGANWNQVVTAAANEVGGQGFVTELSGPSADFVQPMLRTGFEQSWQMVRSEDWTGRELDLLFRVNGFFRNWDGLLSAYETYVPVPSETTLRDFLNCPSCWGVNGPALPGLDVNAFLTYVEANVVAPVRTSDQLLQSQPQITRLYTTMSAEEMTKDPTFDFNPDLPDVSNVYQARAVRSGCGQPVEVTLPNGSIVVATDSFTWPNQPGQGMPANSRVTRFGLEGPEVIVEDNRTTIEESLPSPRSENCRATSSSSAGLPLLGAGLVLSWMLRRRRRG